jgi:phosphatidylserine/phosphatidylglycerophosphate/cardiolipin synthase-like enzyme
MTIANPRWLIDGASASAFAFGRRAEMAVDVSNFAGGDITFLLKKSAVTVPLHPWARRVPAVGSTPITVSIPVTLNRMWPVLQHVPTKYSLYQESCKAGGPRPYPTNAWFLQETVTDDLLYPPLFFTAAEPGQPAVQSPTIRRSSPRYVPGNLAELLVDGDKVLANLLPALDAAQQHIHINWFFFAPDVIGSKVIAKLLAAVQRGIEVRVQFDIEATAVPEPLGQGVNPRLLFAAVESMKAAGVKIADSGGLLPPLDRLTPITDPEYRDRLAVMKEYVQTLMLANGLPIAAATLPQLVGFDKPGGLFGSIRRALTGLKKIEELGSAGIGTPVLLGGARDHSKLIIIDGTTAFCGGLNCQKTYLFETPFDPTKDNDDEVKDPTNPEPWVKWHDVFVRIEGPAVADCQKYFIERWAVNSGEYLSRSSPKYFPTPVSAGTARVKFITNVPGLERDVSAEYLRMFHGAQQRILVENPYVTDDLIAVYLAHAAKVRQIPVDLIVPDKHLDFAIARDLMRARWDAFRDSGIKLFAYEKHMSHVKVATADGQYSIVGTYNFAKSSAAQLLECAFAVDDADFATQVEQLIFDVDRPVADRVTTATGYDWGTQCQGLNRFFENVV